MELFKIADVAKKLNISRQTVYNKIKELEIKPIVKKGVKHLTKEQILSIEMSINGLQLDSDFDNLDNGFDNLADHYTTPEGARKGVDESVLIENRELYLEQINTLKKQIEGLEQDKKDLKQQVKDKEYQFAYLLSINQEQQKALNSLENNNYSKQDISLWEKIKNKLKGST